MFTELTIAETQLPRAPTRNADMKAIVCITRHAQYRLPVPDGAPAADGAAAADSAGEFAGFPDSRPFSPIRRGSFTGIRRRYDESPNRNIAIPPFLSIVPETVFGRTSPEPHIPGKLPRNHRTLPSDCWFADISRFSSCTLTDITAVRHNQFAPIQPAESAKRPIPQQGRPLRNVPAYAPYGTTCTAS